MDLDEEYEVFCNEYEQEDNVDMNLYEIQPYTYEKAKSHNLLVFPSVNPHKKLDVYDKNGNKYICSVGDIRYIDYPTFFKKYGEDYAEARRQLHIIQLQRKQRKFKNYSSQYYENLLLW